MTVWSAPPPTVTWTLDPPIETASFKISTITLKAPTIGQMQKCSAVRGMSTQEVALRIIAEVASERPTYEATQQIPSHIIDQMVEYIGSFGGSPAPSPLQEWREKRAAAERAEAQALLAAAQAASPPAAEEHRGPDGTSRPSS
jgi:hypothetical protein